MQTPPSEEKPLNFIHQVSKYDSLLMHFEGQPIISTDVPAGLVKSAPIDADPVSALLVPHLDRIYNEMSRLCAGRGEDPHRWINPEFHGWWTGRDFVIVVDIETGNLKAVDTFITRFYNSYHPFYNNNQPVIHPQPVGVAVTDSNANFVGWHAITLIRVALDQKNQMRVYFYNPNNDSGQNWGNGAVASTQGHVKDSVRRPCRFRSLFHGYIFFMMTRWTIPIRHRFRRWNCKRSRI